VGGPGCQALSRAQGSIGVPPVFSIRVQDDDQKLAGRTLPRSHEPICSRHSATQARRLCYHRLGVMPPLRPNSRGTSCQATIAPSLRDISQHALASITIISECYAESVSIAEVSRNSAFWCSSKTNFTSHLSTRSGRSCAPSSTTQNRSGKKSYCFGKGEPVRTERNL